MAKTARVSRQRGNPIKLTGHEEIDVNTPLKAPGLSEHREEILEELKAKECSYASSSTTDNFDFEDDSNPSVDDFEAATNSNLN